MAKRLPDCPRFHEPKHLAKRQKRETDTKERGGGGGGGGGGGDGGARDEVKQSSLSRATSDKDEENHLSAFLIGVTSLLPDLVNLIRQFASNIGVIVHWGLYSVPAFDSVDSARRRHIQNGSEWYAKRLVVAPSAYHPTSGWQETQKFHRDTFGAGVGYAHFKDQFTAANWDVDEWMCIFKRSGASYVILTAKHHDGFCLWPTSTTSFATPSSGARIAGHSDIVGEFRTAARRHGMRFGLYYSWSEFDRGATVEYMNTIVRRQINELIQYGPDIFWFDGDWACSTLSSQKVIDECIGRIRRILPNAEINDRVGHKSDRKNLNYLGQSTFRVYEDRALPSREPRVPWEHINTIGLSWGRNSQQTEQDYKSAAELFALYRRVTALKGRFLLNVGPNADGTLCETEATRLIEFGRLLDHSH